MRTLVLLLLLLFAACSPTTRALGRCPTAPTLVTDFVIASVALGASVHQYNKGDTAGTVVLFSSAMLVGLAANLSECRR